nr:NB-ARC domains-containing protein [Tanacetum cinerariifolium]
MTYNKFKAFERANSLRTFLAMPNVVGNGWQIFFLSCKVLDDILLKLPLLRVLSLSCLDIDEVPECVGNMKHLRDEVWRGVMDYLGAVEEVSIWSCDEFKDVEISDCSSIESFPAADLPNLTSLTHLTIVNCKNMDVDSFGLWPPKLGFLEIGGLKKPISKLGPPNFPPSLVELRLWGGSAEEDDVSSRSQLSHMLPSSLTKLDLCFFGKLESVSIGLQHLTTLQHLVISRCPKIQDLPETLLPSLLTLNIWGCPDNLKEKISRRGSYWPLVSYIPYMEIS